ncbi:MAG: ExeA family protein [Kiritimatiellia bacterium]
MYLDFYQLKEMPFNITPDPRFLYFTGRHREAFDHLLYGIEHRKGFIQLTGEVGSGKTTLCRAVLSQLPTTIRTALVLNPCLSETQLLRAIINDFGLDPSGNDRLAYIEQLNEFLLGQLNEGYNVALIIDEAQDLEPEVMEQIRLLNNLETDQHKLMQIVLVGQPELEEKLSRNELRQLRQRITVKAHLSALSEEETGEYIAHRLQVAGAQGRLSFDRAAVRQIHKVAQGTPRVVNTIADRAMMAGYIMNTFSIGAKEVKRAIRDLEMKP